MKLQRPFLYSCVLHFSSYALSATADINEVVKQDVVSKLTPLPNANHIFNTIHSSMRQWGSSVQHNGMSYFLASVPQGTQFYHGSPSSKPVEGTEWLAFEAEHALLFARPTSGLPPRKGRPPHEREPGGRRPPALSSIAAHGVTSPQEILHPSPDVKNQESRMDDQEGDDTPKDYGYLHTYTAAHPLRLLYIDGMSAAKCPIGTMESQDVVLLNHTTTPVPGYGLWERERADRLCNLTRTLWNNTIQGFVRMEAGFEIVLCDFEQDLKVERITGAKRGLTGLSNEVTSWEYYRAASQRYEGIGGGRVKLYYDDFVTAYDWEKFGADLFKDRESKSDLPHLDHLDSSTTEAIKSDITRLVLSGADKNPSVDWQAVTDMYVTRYAEKLARLAAPSAERDISTTDQLALEIEILLRPFIDYADRNHTAVIERCAGHFIPHNIDFAASASLAHRSILSTATTLCTVLVSSYHLVSNSSTASFSSIPSQSTPFTAAISNIRSLVTYLNWPIWNFCSKTDDTTGAITPGCARDEFCFIAIWPLGSKSDHFAPQCVKRRGFLPRPGERYWGRDGFPHFDGENAAGAEMEEQEQPWMVETRERLRLFMG